MTINSIKYISEVIFDHTEKKKNQTNKQSSFRFLLDFLKVCGGKYRFLLARTVVETAVAIENGE